MRTTHARTDAGEYTRLGRGLTQTSSQGSDKTQNVHPHTERFQADSGTLFWLLLLALLLAGVAVQSFASCL